MKYLLYYSDLYLKKFPCNKEVITIGRGNENDLIINDEFISWTHLKIEVLEESIRINDLESSNGTFVKLERKKDCLIRVGESFSIGGVEIFLKQGTLEEFKTAKQLAPVFNGIRKDNRRKFKPVKTKVMADVYREMLKCILRSGLSCDRCSDFIVEVSHSLSGFKHFGNLFIVQNYKNDINILLSINKCDMNEINLRDIISRNKDIFSDPITDANIEESGYYYHSIPIQVNSIESALLYIFAKDKIQDREKLLTFLSCLAEEIQLFSKLLQNEPIHSANSMNESDYQDNSDQDNKIDIVASSELMNDLIEQSKKIAASDIFLLIQGESGTGKELFARLIHQQSSRNNESFVAINCAAIPENLLESELFGYEKGAFTGAYAQKRGKLEIASGGTLVLDEIGDMPLNLQSKLLRAIEENEFYRLGGNEPINVDLRIISITNKDLDQMIQAGQFRRDLYYRLVHRVILIPPLRKRKEDIPILINHFTNHFCRKLEKTVKGYSLRAFQIMQDYYWDGNVRQLENEVRSICSLVDNGDMVTHDLISDQIKSDISKESVKQIDISRIGDPVAEKEMIMKLLEENQWNQSKTARQLNMTYWGFHKKIKRIGIEIPKDK